MAELDRDPLRPVPYRVVQRREDMPGTITLGLEPASEQLPAALPGQFLMVWAPGVGEVPISVSQIDPLELTIRTAGHTTAALTSRQVGQVVGLRGPFGRPWVLPASGPVLVMAGGIGLAPLRPVVAAALADGRLLTVLVGARTPDQLLWAEAFGEWERHGASVLATVDTADRSWHGTVGPVTVLLDRVTPPWSSLTAYVCGPEVMMRFSARGLVDRGVPASQVQVSLERNMHCGIAQCGRCQVGEVLLCRDGPVVTWDRAQPLVEVRQR